VWLVIVIGQFSLLNTKIRSSPACSRKKNKVPGSIAWERYLREAFTRMGWKCPHVPGTGWRSWVEECCCLWPCFVWLAIDILSVFFVKVYDVQSIYRTCSAVEYKLIAGKCGDVNSWSDYGWFTMWPRELCACFYGLLWFMILFLFLFSSPPFLTLCDSDTCVQWLDLCSAVHITILLICMWCSPCLAFVSVSLCSLIILPSADDSFRSANGEFRELPPVELSNLPFILKVGFFLLCSSHVKMLLFCISLHSHSIYCYLLCFGPMFNMLCVWAENCGLGVAWSCFWSPISSWWIHVDIW